MTTLVWLAERDGLAERRADPDDGRAVRVHLTARSRRFRPAVERVLAQLDALLDDALGPRRVSTLRNALESVAALAPASAEAAG